MSYDVGCRAIRGTTICRVSGLLPFTQRCSMRLLEAIRQFLLSLAVLGLLLGPLAGSAYQTMGIDQTIDMADHSPCCPKNPVDDCSKCALMVSCAVHCIGNLAVDLAFAVLIDDREATVTAVFSDSLAGVDHPPPLRPPSA